MHSITDRRTDRRTDGQQAAANSRSYCVAVRSAKNEGEESNMCYTCSALQSGHDEFTHARSRWGQCVGCAKIAGSMRKQFVPLRVHCGHVRALRELCVTDASTVREQDADTASRQAAVQRTTEMARIATTHCVPLREQKSCCQCPLIVTLVLSCTVSEIRRLIC